MMDQLPVSSVQEMAHKFVTDRGWQQYHHPKNLAISISIEASELLEMFQWTDKQPDATTTQNIGLELADVMLYCASLANSLGIDLSSAILEKVERNNKKYPVNLVKGASNWQEIERRLMDRDQTFDE
jgi:dCTP diphosphatase